MIQDFGRFAYGLNRILAWDPGRRGLLASLPQANLAEAAGKLAKAGRVLVVTGFPVACRGVGETDGPLGAAHIAHGLTALGKQVVIVTDQWSEELLKAACVCRAPGARVEIIPWQGAAEACRRLMEQERPEIVISIERPGKGADGHFHNMRGQTIDHLTADTDLLLALAPCSIAIGDGGNELGMGAFAAQIHAGVPQGPLICAQQAAEYPLAAGVSNWWGWGIEAVLSLCSGRDLLPSDREEAEVLAQVVEAGGVDGVTGRQELTVDGLSLEENLRILRQVRGILAKWTAEYWKGAI